MRPQACVSKAGEPGDCYRACIATVTGHDIHGIPNFNALAVGEGFDHSANMQKMAREYLALYGLAIFETYCNGEWPLDRALEHLSAYNTGAPVILHGKPERSCDPGHSVVLLDGRIVHDPSGAGIAGPIRCSDGRAWWFAETICLSAQGIEARQGGDGTAPSQDESPVA